MTTTQSSRHILMRLGEAKLPDAILGHLRDEVVLAGWMRGSAVLENVRLRSPGSEIRTLSGRLHAVTLEGSIGLASGDVTCGLRAVLCRETDSGLETIAGEIVEAKVLALEAVITAFDELTATRHAGPNGVWLLEAIDKPETSRPTPAAVPAAAPVAAPAPAPPPAAAPSAPAVPTAPASDPTLPKTPPAAPKPSPSPTFSAAALPPRPVKPIDLEEEQIYPDAGDVVEHFAFGRCEVIKSDGDRLHLRLGKDGRIKEIALEMLKVTPLPPAEGATGRHFKLDRKL